VVAIRLRDGDRGLSAGRRLSPLRPHSTRLGGVLAARVDLLGRGSRPHSRPRWSAVSGSYG